MTKPKSTTPTALQERQRLIERRDDLQTRYILSDIGSELYSDPACDQKTACKIFKAMIFIQDRAAYREHVESGEVLQINDEGEIRWAYPGEAR